MYLCFRGEGGCYYITRVIIGGDKDAAGECVRIVLAAIELDTNQALGNTINTVFLE